MRVVKRSTSTSLCNSFCSNVAKQVACFCCPFFSTLTKIYINLQARSSVTTGIPNSLGERFMLIINTSGNVG